jgi:hypothetical protein
MKGLRAKPRSRTTFDNTDVVVLQATVRTLDAIHLASALGLQILWVDP